MRRFIPSAAALFTATFVIVYALLPSALASAQSDGADMSVIVITSNTEHPRPGDRVHVMAQSSLLDLSSMHIVWNADGKTIAEGTGVVEADVTAPSSGKTVDVTCIADDSGESASATIHIVPTTIDLLYESDSYTPPFFKGRALPLVPAHVRIQAEPYFKRSNGSYVPDDQLYFTWRVNGTIVQGASGKGKVSALLDAPALFGQDTVSVDIASGDGAYGDSAAINIISPPQLVALYENHPLFGIMYYQSLPTQANIPDSEMTFEAVPYFAAVSDPNDISLQYNWRVNNKPVSRGSASRSELAADSKAGNPVAIDLEVTNAKSLYYDPSGMWTVNFSATSENGDDGPAVDLFHQQPQQ